MSCDAAALALSLHLASLRTGASEPHLLRVAAAAAPGPLAREPLFASIVASAGRLQHEVDALRHAPSPTVAGLDAQAEALAALDMQGHLELARRGTDGDLKCILRGIAQDLPRKLQACRAAPDAPARRAALDELWFLLRDNVEVVTTPASAQSGDRVAG